MLRNEFREDPRLPILIGDANFTTLVRQGTDAAAEGLNFQFCGAIVNYDMPWNPMRVEQRISRIDRLGQRFPRIRIVNLLYENTVETDVYLARRTRIGLFSRFVGKLQPILASLPRLLSETILVSPREQRERGRDTLVANIGDQVHELETQRFDLDAITEADLDEPVRPAPSSIWTHWMCSSAGGSACRPGSV